MTFKPGDKVICINDFNKIGMYFTTIRMGKIYTVIEDGGFEDGILLKEFPTDRFYPYRFERANSRFIKDRLGIK